MKKHKVLAWLLYFQAIGIIGLFSFRHVPSVVARVSTDLHSMIVATSETASIILGGTLFLTARSISMRRKQAWVFALSLQSLLIIASLIRTFHRLFFHQSLISSLVNRLRIPQLISEIIILFLLILWRKNFRTIAGPRTFRKAAIAAVRSVIISALFGFLYIYLDRRLYVDPPSFTSAFRITFKGLIGISDSIAYKTPKVQERIEMLLAGLGLASVVAACWQLFKPSEKNTLLSLEDESKLRQIIAKTPDVDSLSYFALRDNKSIIWARNQKAAIAYSVVRGVMITTGDPIGDRESWPDAMKQFINEAELHAWTPCIYGCSERAGEIWVRETGFTALEIGDEAVVHVNDFTLEGSAMKNVRQMIARVRRTGIITHTKKITDLSALEKEQFARLANEWRRGEEERGFSMALGRFCDERDPDLVITWAEQNGLPVALLQFVPWDSNGLSLDIMRRKNGAELGVNEELIASTIEWAKANNIERVSLNFATFRRIFESATKLGAGPITRFNYRFLKFLSQFAQMESLYRFNAKFRPVWEPRFIVYPGASNLVRVTLAILTIESFWPPVRLSKR